MSKDMISAIGEESMKKYLELAISSMKNIETVRSVFVLLVEELVI